MSGPPKLISREEKRAWRNARAVAIEAWHRENPDISEDDAGLRDFVEGALNGSVRLVTELPAFYKFGYMRSPSLSSGVLPQVRGDYMPVDYSEGKFVDGVLECRVPLQNGNTCLMYIMTGSLDGGRLPDYYGCAFAVRPESDRETQSMRVARVAGNGALHFDDIVGFVNKAEDTGQLFFLPFPDPIHEIRDAA